MELDSVGTCKALYNFTPEHEDELALKEGGWWINAAHPCKDAVADEVYCSTGDLLDICTKGDNGWWLGKLNGQKGHFPSTYVEELPMPNQMRSSDAWMTGLMKSGNTKEHGSTGLYVQQQNMHHLLTSKRQNIHHLLTSKRQLSRAKCSALLCKVVKIDNVYAKYFLGNIYNAFHIGKLKYWHFTVELHWLEKRIFIYLAKWAMLKTINEVLIWMIL